jgi:hypothetical protein
MAFLNDHENIITKMPMPRASHEVLGSVIRHKRAVKGLWSRVKDAEGERDMAERGMAIRDVFIE